MTVPVYSNWEVYPQDHPNRAVRVGAFAERGAKLKGKVILVRRGIIQKTTHPGNLVAIRVAGSSVGGAGGVL